MRRFDYSFLDNGLLPAGLVNLTSDIYSLKTMAGTRKDEYAQIFTELERIAKIQSIKSSNAIEGIVTSDDRILEIVNGHSAPLNHNEAEIAGYRDALNIIHTEHSHLDFCQRDILSLLSQNYFNEAAILVQRALDAGGADNATCIVLEIIDEI